MEKKVVFQASAVAALIAFLAVLVMAFGVPVPESGIDLQPSLTFGPVSKFVYPLNTYPRLALRLFAADSLFVLSYVLVFAGLYVATRERSPVFAAMGLGAGILTALFDGVENAYLISYAASAAEGVTLSEPALPLIYVVANLKWMGAFAALYAYGLIWPRAGRMEWVLTGLMLLFPIVGVLGVVAPSLVPVRGIFFLLGMPLFAWYFWRKARA